MKVLIIGLGSIAKKHINALYNIDGDLQLYALRSSANAQNIYGVNNLYDFSEISAINPDFIIVSNPTSEHYKTIKEISRHNIPLFIEKPLFSEINNKTEELVEVVFHTTVPTYVACNLRFLDCLKEIRKIIVNKRINEANVYCGSYLPDWRPNTNYRTGYSANKEMGGGVHIDLIHELDYIYWLFGSPRSTKSTFTSKSSLNISSYDYANYLWDYESFSANIVLNYYRKDAKRQLEIVTDEETYLVNLLENSIHRNGELVYKSTQTILNTYELQLRFFLESILSKKEVFNSMQEAYNILKLCIKD